MLEVLLDNIKTEEELTKDEYTILYSILHFAPEIEAFKNQTLLSKAINMMAIKDSPVAISAYNRLNYDIKQAVMKDINWKVIDENLRKDLEINRNDVYGIIKAYNEVSEAQIEELNIGYYKRRAEELLKESPEETLQQVFTFANIKSKGLNYLFIEMLIDAQKKGTYILSSNEKMELSINELKELLKRVQIKEIPDNSKLYITAKNISQLSSEFLSQLEDKVEKIRLIRENYYYDVYSFEEIKMCRQVIDKLLEGIDLKNDEKKSEKKIFNKVVKRLARHIKYDYELIRKEERLEKLRKKVKNPEISEKAKEKNNEKIKSLNIRKQSKDARTMTSGLLKGKAVCAGYAEIVNQVFACLGIEAKEISGKPEKR